MNVKIYSIESPDWVKQLNDEMMTENTDGDLEASKSYCYDTMSFDEVLMLAKRDPAAYGELCIRMNKNIRIVVAYHCNRNPNLNFDDTCFRMNVILKKAIEIYDPEKGDFMHLFRSMYKKNMTWTGWKESVRYQRELETFGKRISYAEAVLLLSDANNEENVYQNRAIGIDLREYARNLSGRKKEIFTLYYLKNCSVQEICNIVQEPYSTVYTILKAMFEEFKRFIGENKKE